MFQFCFSPLPHQSFQVATHLPTWQGCIKNCNDILSSFWRSNKNTTAAQLKLKEWEGISRGGSIFSIKVDLWSWTTKILGYGAAFILQDSLMLLMANYNELINMLHKLIFNARSVNFAWFIWGPYAIFGLIVLIDFTCLQSMEEVKTLNKWDISGEFSNTVDYIVIPGGGTDHHIFPVASSSVVSQSMSN